MATSEKVLTKVLTVKEYERDAYDGQSARIDNDEYEGDHGGARHQDEVGQQPGHHQHSILQY